MFILEFSRNSKVWDAHWFQAILWTFLESELSAVVLKVVVVMARALQCTAGARHKVKNRLGTICRHWPCAREPLPPSAVLTELFF